MYIKDNKLYFEKNNYIYFGNLKLTRNSWSTREQRIYLITLKKLFEAIYNSLFLLEKYNLKLIDHIEFYNFNCKNTVKFSLDSDIVYAITINYNSTHNERVILIEQTDDEKFYLKIEKNILYHNGSSYKTTIYFPNEFEHSIEYNDIDLDFGHYDEFANYISKYDCMNICIRSDTPQLLLLRFLECINAFKQVDEFEINNEYDLLKYL